jgi:two-component system, OmpR family, response regulator
MRLLIIEDEPDLVRALDIFMQDEGFAVDTAEDGDAGLEKALAWEYDAIVLDIMLPKRDGWSVLSELRTKKQTPVLLLTARDALQDRIAGLDSGADDYLIKPFELHELSARIRALIRRSAGVTQSTILLEDIVVDIAGKQVRRGEEVINLTAMEYALVEYLALHRGRVVTRSNLYDHLFDESEDSLSNLLDVHVSNIRRKLGKDFITTRRGQGYIIDV